MPPMPLSASARHLGPREVRAAYNAMHATAIIRDRDRFYRTMAARALRFLGPRPRSGARALDVGCGGGYLLREIARAAPGAGLVLGQGERLPYPDRTFDIVACLGNLEHFLDPEAGARELARVTRL
ncbi:MAG TPA: class I SAM-dependent methyltransferase, partial [Planctomycetota bacterium]|nr:class I SAM-dependent methyltransferase [Planctomycetota bacterium]